jgi:alpha-N-arabinofuranosidase
MKTPALTKILRRFTPALVLLGATGTLRAADAPAPDATNPVATITINADQVKGHSSPILYGFMTEEINYSYDGGLYGELIANRTFQDPPANLKRWSLVEDPGAAGTMDFDTSEKYNDQLPVSLKLTATTASDKLRVGVANEGFWGIPVRPSTAYHASFYAKADGSFTGPLTIAISSTTRAVTYAYATVPQLTNTWQKYDVTLTTDGSVTPTKDANFLIWTNSPGTAWFSLVSLFPPTYNNRPNGNRPDLMQLLADYHPAFLRFPGGNYLEGNGLAGRFEWKKTIGDISQRPGHEGPWSYRSSDGMGLLEFLEWCEDLKMQPLLAVYAGLALGSGEVAPGADLQPYVQDALDEIEYVTGDTSTKWGAERAKDGHPEPFKLNYVEIGNEDRRGDSNGRITQIYNAIKAKYPNLQLIDSSIIGSTNKTGRLTSRVTSITTDVQDSHLYMNSELQADTESADYDKYDRTGPKVFEGEWATRVPRTSATPDFQGALGDAAYMTGLERNSDAVIMASYAPLFVNVTNAQAGRSPNSSMEWACDLIGYDALSSYGSPSYYAQVMFNNNRGDEILATDSANLPTRASAPPAAPRSPGPAATNVTRGPVLTNNTPPNQSGTNPAGSATAAAPAASAPPAQARPPRQIPALFFSTTRDSKTGVIYFKVVNPLATATPIQVNITGATAIAADGESVVMKADSLTDTNSIAEPKKIIPVTTPENGFSASFTRTLPPYSITILKLQSK